MNASVPPWLDVSPSQFASAASQGAHLMLAQKQMQDEAAQNAQKLQMARQSQEAQMSEWAKNFEVQNQRAAVDVAQRQQVLQLQTSTAAKKYQAQQKYQQLVAGGMEPTQAMLMVGPELGINMTGVGQLANQERLSRQAVVPEVMDLGDGVKGVKFGNTFHVLPQPKAKAGLSPEMQAQIKDLDDQIKHHEGIAEKASLASLGSNFDPDKEVMRSRLVKDEQKILEALRKKRQATLTGVDEDDGADAGESSTAPQPEVAFTYDPSTGDFTKPKSGE